MLTILVLESNRLVRTMYVSGLSAFDNIEVIETSTAEEAVALIENGLQPDVLLTDIQLNGVSNEQFVEWFKTTCPYTQVMISSASNDFIPGMDVLLPKPARPNEIFSALR
ncbi:MAG: response regulator [Phototrophicaceae bacterium]|jgi:CheY-like chemotaxis protein